MLHLSVAAAIVAVMAVFTVFVLLSRLCILKRADADKAAQLQRYAVITDAEAEATRLSQEAQQQARATTENARVVANALEEEATALLSEAQSTSLSLQEQIATLRTSYSEKKESMMRWKKRLPCIARRKRLQRWACLNPILISIPQKNLKTP